VVPDPIVIEPWLDASHVDEKRIDLGGVERSSRGARLFQPDETVARRRLVAVAPEGVLEDLLELAT
jgi:hypothetical protein